MLKEIRYNNFKSFDYTSLCLDDMVSIIIGSNASGKTNAIEGLKVLSLLAHGASVNSIFEKTNSGITPIRGGARNCIGSKNERFSLCCVLDFSDYKLSYEIEFDVSNKISIFREEVRKYSENDTKLIFLYNFDADNSANIKFSTGLKITLSSIPDISILHTFINIISGYNDIEEDIKETKLLVNQLKNIYFLELNPSFMHDYVNASETQLISDGSNVSSVLYNMCVKSDKAIENKKILLDIIRNIPENEIEDIDFEVTRLNDVMLLIKEKYNDKLIEARSLSDGTLRCLAIVATLLSLSETSTIVMEEIDNGVHPSRVCSLLQHITKIAIKRQLSIIATTHNPAIIDAVAPRDKKNIKLCYRKPCTGVSEFINIIDVPNYYGMVAECL